MAELTPVTLTPQEQAEFEQQQQPSGPAPLNPIRDLNAQELFDLATKDKEFDIAAEFGRQPDLHADPAVVQKAADALHLVRQRGFEFSDLPGVTDVAKAGAGIIKGFGKQAWNYLTAGVNTAMSLVTPQGVSDALTSEAQRRVAENIAGSESAVTGLGEMAATGAGKIGRGLGVSKSLEAFTPEEKVKHLFDAAGKIEVQQDISKGEGAFLGAVGGEVVKDLAAEGKPVRPEEVTELAAGDPFSWWTFGKVLGATGKIPGAVASKLPAPVQAAAARVSQGAADLAETAATKVGGRSLQALGETARVAGKVGQVAAPAVGMVKGALEAGPLGALAGLKGGELVRGISRRVGAAGERLAQVGADIATPGAVSSAGAQLGRDVFASVPGVVGQTAHGLGMDIGLAAVTAETPAETQASVGIGATLGALGGARRAGQRILSGQLIAPRQWGTNRPVPSSGQFPSLDAAHTVAYQTAAPGVRARVNAVRDFARGAAPGTDVFLFRDSASVEQALTQAGVSPERAREFGQQEGFFTVDLPSRDGSQRRVIIVRNIEAAPHESFHAIQDVLGEGANQAIDQIVQREYADRWDSEGNKYASRLNDNQPVQNWRDTINDASGWGHAEAMEKLSREAGNRIRNETGAEPDPSAVRDMVQAAWDAARGNPRDAWREILTPEEQAAVADRYLARELAAENFDAIFKHTGPSLNDQPGVLGTLSRIAGNLVSTLGGEPLAGRSSEFGRVPLSTPVVEAARGAARGQRPTIEPPTAPGAPAPRPQTPTAPADEALEIANNAPDVVPPGGTRSPRALLTDIANAIGQRAGVRINYLSAPGEPAAATTSNRGARRAIIEAFRNMPPAARALWEKTFFPERVIQRSSGTQIFGWAPEVFASNAHKLSAVLAADPNLQRFSPYALDPATGTFTEAGWRELFADTQKFVQNQIAGQTGAGEALVVPRETAARGVFAPEGRPAETAPLAQDRADFISMLFNSRLPDTPRLAQGRPSLNIVGQEISAATRPGRVERPVVARDPFSGEEAARQGVEGREIMEVNPLRNALTRELGDRMPSFVEANQRLNLENIREVQVTPEVPEFRGNTLTLAAGFQPRTEAGRKVVEDKGFEYRMAPPNDFGITRISLHDPKLRGESYTSDNPGYRDGTKADPTEIAFVEIGEENPTTAHLEFIWTSPDYRNRGIGEALQREAGAFVRDEGYSKLTGTVVNPDALKLVQKVYPGTKLQQQRTRKGEPIPIVLRESPITPESQFQPAAARARELLTMDDATWDAATKYQGKMGGGFTGWAYEIGAAAKDASDLQAMRETYNTLTAAAREAMAAKDMRTAMPLVAKAQASREAYEAATGETLDGRSEATVPFMKKHLDPNYEPPLPGEAYKRWQAEQGKEIEAQAQPVRNDDVASVADEYSKKAGIEYRAPGNYSKVPEESAQKIADWYGKAKHAPESPEVKQSYDALSKEILDQYQSIVDAGYTLEKWTGEGEPYKNSAEMVADVKDNKHLFFMPTDKSFSGEGDNHMLKPSGINDWVVNDVFRAVHDFFGHAKEGLQFGPRGEFNAWREHSAMFSDEAQPALAAETLAQNFWVNFGEQVRGKDIAPKDRPFAEQKNVAVPAELIDEVRGQFAPKKSKDQYKFPKLGSGGFKKAWILPNGEVQQLGGTWHHEWLADNRDVAKKFGLDKVPQFQGNDIEGVREAALQKGFVRVNFGVNNGLLTIEGRAKDWRKIRPAMEQLVEKNLDDVYSVKVLLFDDKIAKVVDSEEQRIFNFEDHEKMDHLPFSDRDPRGTGASAQFQPQPEETIRRIQKQRVRGGGFFRNLMQKEAERKAPSKPQVTVPSDDAVTEALSENKKEFVGAHRELPEGSEIGVRIDIPAFLKTGDYVQTVHEKASGGRVGKRIGYDGIVTVDEPTFFSNEAGAQKIKSGEAKFPVATVEGKYNPSREVPEDLSGWTEVGYNPRKHSYFYEKGTEELVTGGEQAVSVGNSVWVKNATFGDKATAAFQPKQAEPDFFPETQTSKKPLLTGKQMNDMTRAQIEEHFPEAILPKGKREDLMTSDILESPLYKQFKNEAEAVNAFGDKLVEFARKWQDHPAYKDGIGWYSEFVPMLAEFFGKDAPIVAELLAATSPQTSVNTNYRYALEAIDLMNSGKLDKITKKFEQGLEMMDSGSWKEWINSEIAAGKVPKPPKKVSPATFLAHWIETHNLKPVRNNGKLFGQHSVPVLQVLARKWLSDERGLKTQNFVQNILGTGHEATIDLWADRTMRRMGYEGLVDRWRILQANQGGVSDKDFVFSQKAYRNAADKLGVEPDALQAALWFAEKQHWADEGWARLDLGDFRKEIRKTPELRKAAADALTKAEKSATVESEQELITPRYER